MNVHEIMLPHGLWRDGVCHRRAWLRPLDGEDLIFLWERGAELTPAAWTTLLLQRSARRIGEISAVSADDVRQLCVGDREALTLHLRRLTRGDAMPAVLTCPACGADMDLDIQVSKLLVRVDEPISLVHQTDIVHDGRAYSAHFRLPTGEDQEAVLDLALQDMQAARRQLLGRCILSVEDLSLDSLPDAILSDIIEHMGSLMANLDPQADLWFQVTCPECSHFFQAPFDPASYFRRELEDEAVVLFEEIHTLALSYHWPEDAILRLSRRRRQRYLAMIEESLSVYG